MERDVEDPERTFSGFIPSGPGVVLCSWLRQGLARLNGKAEKPEKRRSQQAACHRLLFKYLSSRTGTPRLHDAHVGPRFRPLIKRHDRDT